jgi:ABC-type antimicrobial peptide transport system permease subunit
VILLLSLVAFTAALVPALRARRLDPIAALRNN